QRWYLAVRVDRKILGRPMLALRGVDVNVLVGKAQFLQCPGNAGAGAARPGVKLDRHHRLLVGTRAGSVHPKAAACIAAGRFPAGPVYPSTGSSGSSFALASPLASGKCATSSAETSSSA